MKIVSSDFESLTSTQLYDILKLRQDVFLWEENIHVPDLDDVDKVAVHVFALDKEKGEEIVASYARVYWDITEKRARIGRVVTAQAYRGKGLASKVMKAAIDIACEKFKAEEIWLHAQTQAIPFYEGTGFNVASEEYIEEGLPHKLMVWRKGK